MSLDASRAALPRKSPSVTRIYHCNRVSIDFAPFGIGLSCSSISYTKHTQIAIHVRSNTMPLDRWRTRRRTREIDFTKIQSSLFGLALFPKYQNTLKRIDKHTTLLNTLEQNTHCIVPHVVHMLHLHSPKHTHVLIYKYTN